MSPTEIIWTPYCGAAPSPEAWLGRWNLDALLLVCLVAGFAGLFLWRRERTDRRWLIGAAAVLVVGFVSPLCALSSALFAARTVHHVLLIGVAAPMLALALPRLTRSRLGVVTAVQAVVLYLWHAPDLYGAALSHDAVYWLMQGSLLASAIWFWAAVRAASAPGGVAGLLFAMLAMGLLGALLTFTGQPVYAPHFASTLAWGLTPLEDQQAAGLIMWAPAAALYLFAAIWRLGRMLSLAPEVLA
jgi:putative membrane protein